MPKKAFYRLMASLVSILHFSLIPYSLLAWLIPNKIWLWVHIIFVPGMILHWQINRNVCVLNNLEHWLKTGSWWDENDRMQGNWLRTVIYQWTGFELTHNQTMRITYLVLWISWGISIWRISNI